MYAEVVVMANSEGLFLGTLFIKIYVLNMHCICRVKRDVEFIAGYLNMKLNSCSGDITNRGTGLICLFEWLYLLYVHILAVFQIT